MQYRSFPQPWWALWTAWQELAFCYRTCTPATHTLTNGTRGSNILGRVSLNEKQVGPTTSLNDPSIRETKERSRHDRRRT